MDTLRIIQKDGYTFEDLTKENQNAIQWLRFLVDDIAEQKTNYMDTDGDGLWRKMQNEIARKVIDFIVEYATIQLAEYQIGMIESQDESDV